MMLTHVGSAFMGQSRPHPNELGPLIIRTTLDLERPSSGR